MEYVSSCQAIGVIEEFCQQGIKQGYIELKHDGRIDEDISVYTRIYYISLKASIYPAIVKFWYDKRLKEGSVRKDVAGVKLTLEDLLLILQALSRREISLELPELSIMKDRDGLKIVQK